MKPDRAAELVAGLNRWPYNDDAVMAKIRATFVRLGTPPGWDTNKSLEENERDWNQSRASGRTTTA